MERQNYFLGPSVSFGFVLAFFLFSGLSAKNSTVSISGCPSLEAELSSVICLGEDSLIVDLVISSDGLEGISSTLIIQIGTLEFRFAASFADRQSVQIILPRNITPADLTVFLEGQESCYITIDNFIYSDGCASISGFVWEDSNGNGFRESNEPVIPGAGVSLSNCQDFALIETLSGSDGSYAFRGLSTGGYALQFDLKVTRPTYHKAIPTIQSGNSDIDATGKTSCETLADEGQQLTINAGYYRPAVISGKVWSDTNRDGLRHTSEPVLANVPVSLFECDEAGTPLQTTRSSTDGTYAFEELIPGNYRLRFGFPDTGFFEFVQAFSFADTLNSDVIKKDGWTACIDLGSGAVEKFIDAGYKPCIGVEVMACTGRLNLNMQGSCTLEVTPAMLFSGIATCYSTLEVHLFSFDGIPLGTTVTADYAGDSLQAFVRDKVSGDYCRTILQVHDSVSPVITCPESTSTAEVPKKIYFFRGSANAIQSMSFVDNCWAEASGLASGTAVYPDTVHLKVSGDGIYNMVLFSTWQHNTAVVYDGFMDSDHPCRRAISAVYSNSFSGKLQNRYENLSVLLAEWTGQSDLYPVLEMTLLLKKDANYTLLAARPEGCTEETYVWAIYGDSGLSPKKNGSPDRYLSCESLVRADLLISDADSVYRKYENLEQTGIPGGLDNCTSNLQLEFLDKMEAASCSEVTLYRNFTVRDGSANESNCIQEIRFRQPQLADVIAPPVQVFLECSEIMSLDAEGNPDPQQCGYPLIRSAYGVHSLQSGYANIAAAYRNVSRVERCAGSSVIYRQWTVVDWCKASVFQLLDQYIFIEDTQVPVVKILQTPTDTLFYSTGAFDCTANIQVPVPEVSDACSTTDISAEIRSVVQIPVFNIFGVQIGVQTDTLIIASAVVPFHFSAIPVGCHELLYTAEDACGNQSVFRQAICVSDKVEPVIACKEKLTISLGGLGLARMWASDMVEAAFDACGLEETRIRRLDLVGAHAAYIDFSCLDAGKDVPIELLLEDKAGNSNTCTLYIQVNDNIRPVCTAPPSLVMSCADLPVGFSPEDTTQLQSLFGKPVLQDNCQSRVRWQELAPVVTGSTCSGGSIIRTFMVTDAGGKQPSEACTQTITLLSGFGNIQGSVILANEVPMQQFSIQVSGYMEFGIRGNSDGTYKLEDLPMGESYVIKPECDEDPVAGVSTVDLVLISKHILGVAPLNSPLKIIAADADNSGYVTTLDLIHLRRLILGVDASFQYNSSWRFVDRSYRFPVPENPWYESFPESFRVEWLASEVIGVDFYAIKIGDVDWSLSSGSFLHGSILPDEKQGAISVEWSTTIQTYPNPFNQTLELAVEAASAGQFSYCITDMQGREWLRFSGLIPEGRFRYSIDGTRLPAGFLILTAEKGAYRWQKKIMHLR